MKEGKKIILASQSPRRIQLLKMIGIDAIVKPSDIEEVIRYTIPSEVVMDLSLKKATNVWENIEKRDRDVIVIAADTVVSLNLEILGKPKDREDAYHMLRRLSGREHQVYTGVSLMHDGEISTFYEETIVKVSDMEDSEIYGYIKSGDPMDKAGAYGIQGEFAKYVEYIHGDYYNVMGLPVSRVYRELKAL